jgi:hypothetical protein
MASLRLSLCVIVCLAVFFTAGRSTFAAGRCEQSRSDSSHAWEMPIRFHSEIVRLFIEEDSLRVEGVFRMLCDSSSSEYVPLFFPYPVDSLLGGARSVSVECRALGGDWRPLAHSEIQLRSGVRWWVPVNMADTLEVRAIYRQELRTTYARYIVTTVRLWGRPLEQARFEIYLPEGTRPLEFSYPFELSGSEERPFYVYDTTQFMPEQDIIVRWARDDSGEP